MDTSPPDPMETDEGEESEEPRNRDVTLIQRHSSEEPDSPTADEVNFSMPDDDQEGSPSFNDTDHLSLSDH